MGFSQVSGRFMDASMVNERLAAVYRVMGMGMATAAAVGYWAMTAPWLMSLVKGVGLIVIIIAQFALIVFIGKAMDKWGAQAGRLMFYVVAASMGLTMAPIVKLYSAASISQAFGLSCLVLFVAAAYGYFTKRSLASMGAFMVVGLIGVIVAGIVNLFLHSHVMQMVLDVAAVVIFTGLAACDSQRIRNDLMGATAEQADKIVVMGALSLWLNFVNLFSVLLRLTGEED